ncbi:hypothetical protein ABK040_003705 [Willaertia magna]
MMQRTTRSCLSKKQNKNIFSVLTQNKRNYSNEKDLKKTALYDLHDELKASFVPFAGYKMPVMYNLAQYKDALKREHMQCRNSAALFDVSHMGQVTVVGEDAQEFLETITPSNLQPLKVGGARLTQFTNEKGGILDDLMITKKEEPHRFYVVINAACVESDMKHMLNALETLKSKKSGKLFKETVKVELISGRSLIAVQGPKAIDSVLPLLLSDEARDRVKNTKFMNAVDDVLQVEGSVKGGLPSKASVPVQLSRCGYTGEDGFEISVPDEYAIALAQTLLRVGGTSPIVGAAGLGARDTLRLEAGLCLMGHDMNPEITPIEAGLNFTIMKRRREEGGFPGYEVIKKQLEQGISQLRVGFSYGQETVGTGKAAVIAREGYKFKDLKTGEEIGHVTSGTLSPILGHPIGMGYIKTEYSAEGTEIGIQIRNNLQVAKIVKMPFVPTRYFK